MESGCSPGGFMRKSVMAVELARRLEEVVRIEVPELLGLSEEQASVKNSSAWSPKEELGHLIDSATNNHVRFVRGTLEQDSRGPGYDEVGWVALHGYQEMSWQSLVGFWAEYNRLLARVIGNIPENRLEAKCWVKDAGVTLEFLITDYILHMRRHLDHILRRGMVTEDPGRGVGNRR
jgi:hypothetical protein